MQAQIHDDINRLIEPASADKSPNVDAPMWCPFSSSGVRGWVWDLSTIHAIHRDTNPYRPGEVTLVIAPQKIVTNESTARKICKQWMMARVNASKGPTFMWTGEKGIQFMSFS